MPRKSAPRKSAPRKSAPRKSAPRKSAPRKSAPRKSVPVDDHKEEIKNVSDMSDMSFLPIALSPSHIKNYELEDRLDFLEYYHVCYNPHFLYPIDTTKMFTIKFKDNPSIDPFEMIYDHILKEYPSVQLYLLRIEDQENQKEHIELSEYKKTGKGKNAINNDVATEKLRIEDQSVTKVIFIENQQSNEFGHYGIIFYDSNTRIYSYFDSMVSYDGNRNVSSAYFDRFVEVFQRYFGRDKTVVIEEDDIYRECPNSSLEIIGGEIRLTNPYTEKFHNQLLEEKTNEFYMNQTIMGVDTQNQYCFMWGFAYTFAKLNALSNRERGWSQLFRKMTCDRSVIPVCFIKFFSSFIVNWMGDKSDKSAIGRKRNSAYKTLMDDDLFHYFYNSFISNKKVYRECFDDNDDNNTFHLFINKKGLEVVNSGKIYTIHEIVDALFAFCDEEYSTDVSIQEMSSKNKTFDIDDCRENKNKLVDMDVLIEVILKNISDVFPRLYPFLSNINRLDVLTIVFENLLAGKGLDITTNMKSLLDVKGNLSTFTSFMMYNLYLKQVFCLLSLIDCNYPYININKILQMLCDSTNMNDKITIY